MPEKHSEAWTGALWAVVLDLGQQWAAETSLVGLEQLRHILHILDQMLQAPGKLFLCIVNIFLGVYLCTRTYGLPAEHHIVTH